MTERENFEAWYASLHPGSSLRAVREWLLTQDDGTYDAPIDRHWLAWQASRKQADDDLKGKLAVLSTFAHEILMGAYKPSVAMWKARAALERTGLMELDSVVAIGQKVGEQACT